MFAARLNSRLARFRDDTRGTVTVEMVMTLPLLIWALTATYQYFDLYRYHAVRDKATYTVTDMLSREQAPVTGGYLTGARDLFNAISNDDSDAQLRISVVSYDQENERYSVVWSRIRGTGPMQRLDNSNVRSGDISLPQMIDGQQIVLVESHSAYDPLFRVGLEDRMPVRTSQFMSLRFAPQLCLRTICG